jgi:hypothetical protein
MKCEDCAHLLDRGWVSLSFSSAWYYMVLRVNVEARPELLPKYEGETLVTRCLMKHETIELFSIFQSSAQLS